MKPPMEDLDLGGEGRLELAQAGWNVHARVDDRQDHDGAGAGVADEQVAIHPVEPESGMQVRFRP